LTRLAVALSGILLMSSVQGQDDVGGFEDGGFEESFNGGGFDTEGNGEVFSISNNSDQYAAHEDHASGGGGGFHSSNTFGRSDTHDKDDFEQE